MRKIHYATKNLGKVHSLSAALKPYHIEVVQVPLDLPEPRSDDLREIAREKVLYAYSRIKKPCVALDAGFYIHSLNGFPRAFVNFALETIGVEGILKLTEGKARECEFRSCLAYLDGMLQEPLFFESKTEGVLTDSLRGEMKEYAWSRLFLVFIPALCDDPTDERKTLAEMSPEEFRSWRAGMHHSSASGKFAQWLNQRYNGNI